jgi:hypothetical protein
VLGEVGTILIEERIQIREEPVAVVVRKRSAGVPMTRRHLRLGLRTNADRKADFWERMSYLALWLSGWVTIGLALL